MPETAPSTIIPDTPLDGSAEVDFPALSARPHLPWLRFDSIEDAQEVLSVLTPTVPCVEVSDSHPPSKYIPPRAHILARVAAYESSLLQDTSGPRRSRTPARPSTSRGPLLSFRLFPHMAGLQLPDPNLLVLRGHSLSDPHLAPPVVLQLSFPLLPSPPALCRLFARRLPQTFSPSPSPPLPLTLFLHPLPVLALQSPRLSLQSRLPHLLRLPAPLPASFLPLPLPTHPPVITFLPPRFKLAPRSPRNPSPSAPFRYSSHFGNTPKPRIRHGSSLRTFSHERRAHGTVAGTWTGTQLLEALQRLTNEKITLIRLPGSGLHRQRKFLWHGGYVSVNIWQTGRVHNQGRGSGELARRLSTLPRKPCPDTSHCPSALSDSDSSGEGHYFSKISRGRVLSYITDWFRLVFHFFLLGAFSSVRGCLSMCLPCLSFCSLSPPGEEHPSKTTQDHQGNRLTSRCSQMSTIQADSSRSAGARGGPEFVVQLSHWPADVSPLCLVPPKVWALRFLWDHFVRFLRIPSPALLGPLRSVHSLRLLFAGCCHARLSVFWPRCPRSAWRLFAALSGLFYILFQRFSTRPRPFLFRSHV